MYRGIGSSGGIAQIRAKAVDFGGSDSPLSKEELDKEGLIQFPMVVGGVAPVYNIPGIAKGELRLTPELLADLFLGNVKKWNDRRVRAVNPKLKLPDLEVTVAHRADGSGTTYIFTSYLSKASPEWKSKVGAGNSVSWPTGVGGKGNRWVAELVGKIEGAIGYVEYAYAMEKNLKYAVLQNQAGEFVLPVIKSFQSACENAQWDKATGFQVDLTDQPGAKSWPITGATYILMHKDQPDAAKAAAMLNFFDWCLRKGAQHAVKLHYVPLPEKVATLIEALWESDVTSSGAKVWPPQNRKGGGATPESEDDSAGE
jgi:phosphate transport system substrate-binding protein